MAYYPSINQLMKNARGDTENYFQLLTYNPSLHSSLLTTATLSNKSTRHATIDFIVNDLKCDAQPDTIYESGYFVQTAKEPIAMASLDIDQNNCNITKTYVGREYRRNGIGSMLINICEDLAINLGHNRMFANMHRPEDSMVEIIRSHYSNISPIRNFIENITKQNTSYGRLKANSKFLTKNGYNAEPSPYSYPGKIGLKPAGYLATAEDTTQKDVVKVHLDEFMESLNEFTQEQPANNIDFPFLP